MEALEQLRNSGQSLWMDQIARQQIYNGSLMRYIEDGSITGITLTHPAFCHALHSTTVYDEAICKKLKEDLYGQALAFDLMREDIHHAADLLRHVFDRTNGVDGWAALPVSPLMTDDSDTLLESVVDLYRKINRPNTLITVPGLPDRLDAVEEIVFAGIPINITLTYSSDQFLYAAEACLRGIERRMLSGFKPAVTIFFSIPVFHLTAALSRIMTKEVAEQASIAVARKIYKTTRMLHISQQWERAYTAGARPLRLAWIASDHAATTASDLFLYNRLIAPYTVAAMSEWIMGEFINHGQPEPTMPVDGDNCEEILADHQKAGIDFKHLTNSLQVEAAALQVKTWITLLDGIARRSAAVIKINPP